MLTLEEALQRVLGAVQPLGHEMVALGEAAGRVLPETIRSPLDLPRFDNSAMDGYAVRAADLAGVDAEHPRTLRVCGKIAAGEPRIVTMEAGNCVRLFTGSPLPGGADAVVMQEDTRSDSSRPDYVEFLDTVKPGENVRLRGGDIQCGATLCVAGDRLTAGKLALFAGAGFAGVKASRRPRVALLATGSELLEGGQPAGAGKVYESNRIVLAELTRQVGGIPDIRPLVPDSTGAIRAALEQAGQENDAVITSGGVSVGEFDLVKRVFQELGGELSFWKVAIKPGKPFAFGRLGKVLLFGLPGNPVSAFVTFLLLVRPALASLQGASRTRLPEANAIVSEPLVNPGDRRHFMRVAFDHLGRIRPVGAAQASHVLSSLAQADGLVDVPPRATLPAGTSVSVLRWESD